MTSMTRTLRRRYKRNVEDTRRRGIPHPEAFEAACLLERVGIEFATLIVGDDAVIADAQRIVEREKEIA